ncbi:hypothetical protein QBC44DRAFT_141574 [Cladorrhinum sp. PSN332]|nr:hypothetical protein QBC44DRAFT_141574 [Cladorrhinum sp. PSN332]
MGLVKLPYELVSFVVKDLDLLDVRNLSLVCKRFQYLTQEARIAKQLLETKAPYSLEARHAQLSKQYATQLRRLMKRYEAISAISPCSVAVVAHAESWIYENGFLCYIRDLQLRILDIHNSETSEIVVNLRLLLNETIPESCGARRSKIRVKLLHYAHDIVSCVFTLLAKPASANWLLVFNPQSGQAITTRRLTSTAKIFVRNDARFLYYGTHSEVGEDDEDYRYWQICGFDLGAATWLDDKLDVPEVMGADHGTTICFEIFDGYFYAISNQAALEVEEVDWVSHYTCFRFPIKRDGFRYCKPPPRPIWRRNQVEGVIDDRWYFMRMFRDEATGQLKVVESRKEWLGGRISPRRTYYTTVINFGSSEHVEGGETEDPRTLTLSSDVRSSGASASEVEKMHPAGPMKPKARDPHSVHLGDDNSKSLMFTLGKCPMRSYHTSCQTFIDLVDDPASFDPNAQRIRLRGSSRRPRTPGEYEERKRLLRTQKTGSQDSLDQEIGDLFKEAPVVFWPPDLDASNPDPALVDLYAVLNPEGYQGHIKGVWDERSLVYSTGDDRPGGLKALILVSWDPAIHLAGTTAYASELRNFGRHQQGIGALATLHEGKGKEKETTEWRPSSMPDTTSSRDGSPDSTLSLEPVNGSHWAAVESARYRQISRGLHFSL